MKTNKQIPKNARIIPHIHAPTLFAVPARFTDSSGVMPCAFALGKHSTTIKPRMPDGIQRKALNPFFDAIIGPLTIMPMNKASQKSSNKLIIFWFLVRGLCCLWFDSVCAKAYLL